MLEIIDFKRISKLFPNAFDIFQVAGDDGIKNEKQRFFKWMQGEGCTIRMIYVPENFVWNCEVKYDKGTGNLVHETLANYRNYQDCFLEGVMTAVSLLEFKFKPKDYEKTWLDAITIEAYQRHQAKEFWGTPMGKSLKYKSDVKKRNEKKGSGTDPY